MEIININNIEIRFLSENDSENISLNQIKDIENGYTTKYYYQVNYNNNPNIIDNKKKISFELELKEYEEQKHNVYNYISEDNLQNYKANFKIGHSVGCFNKENNSELLIGFLFAEVETWNNTLKINEIHVHKNYNRKGIGTKMIQLLENKVIEDKRLRGICIETQVNNFPAISFYQQNGYLIKGIDIGFYTNDDLKNNNVAIFLRKEFNLIE